jgi:hypothetical protein
MFVLVTRCLGGVIQPVNFEVSEGEAGIPIFVAEEDAEEFAEAYWDILGPGTELLELENYAMAQLLGECAVRTGYVILNPRPALASGDSVWWEMSNIRDFVEGLGETSP